jgi:hypothetical protein
MKLLFGLFLIAHGLLHLSYLAPKPDDPSYPFDFSKGWLANVLGEAAKPIGTILAIITATCFVLAGLGVFGFPGLESIWQQLAIGGAAASTVLLGFFWHPWLAAGMLINVVLLYGLIEQNWEWVQR